MLRDRSTSRPSATFRTFPPGEAEELLRWVRSDDELRRLAPGTPPPLSADKIHAWKKPDGEVWSLHVGDAEVMIGYAELNPMRHEARHLWLGHVLIKPEERRRGWGRALVSEMIRRAFEARDAQRVSLLVFPDNEPALRCYRVLGFQERGLETHFFPATRRTCTMMRMERLR